MTSVAYVTVDVFTRERFKGNPLAVIADARGLSDGQMQRIAAEFNYSETTFVLPPEDPQNLARVRIFTPTDEIPFAGHPNVGTAFVLGHQGTLFGRAVPDAMRFEQKAGIVPITLLREGGAVSGARIEAPRPLEVGQAIDPQTIAACASLRLEDLKSDGMPMVMISVGLPYAVAEVVDLAALGRARPNAAAFAEADRRYPHPDDRFAVFLVHRLPPDRVRARMFAPLSNTPEDPATGSACAAYGAQVMALRPERDLALELTVEQGIEMGRASTILLGLRKRAGIVQPVEVSGACVPVLAGTLRL